MRRSERTTVGMIPLHTLDADIDYGFTTCVTKSGTIGVKVWVYKGPKPAKAADDTSNQNSAGGTA